VRDGLLAQPAVYAADDAEFDRPRFNYGETKGGSGVASRQGRSAGAGAIKRRGLPYDADSGSFWQLMFGPVGRVYALTCFSCISVDKDNAGNGTIAAVMVLAMFEAV